MKSVVLHHGAHKALPGPAQWKLLLVDADVEALHYYSTVLKQLGCEVHSFVSYGEAADHLMQEAFDLVIVDQGSSEFEGRRVLVRVMEKDRHTPVIVLTRSLDIPCYLEAMQSGARDYLEKPLPRSEIEELLRKYVQTRAVAV